MKIEKGKKYRCVKNPVDSSYIEVGRIYTCIKKNEINEMRIIGAQDRTDWFELVQDPSTEELLKRIEALEGMIEGVIKPKGFSCSDMSDVLDEMQSVTCKPKDELIDAAKEVVKYYRSDRRDSVWAFANSVHLSESISKLELILLEKESE
tara:strand:- start:736 stop:1185 length:450 start_codon:yes stop_codon:yes gene_type:complete